MFQWLKSLFCKNQAPTTEANDLAREALDRMRREELSVGAYLRRGLPVNTAPGQASGLAPKRDFFTPTPALTKEVNSDIRPANSDDFLFSMAVGSATGSAGLGYLAGGSLTGAMVGSSMHDTHGSTSSFEYTRSDCADSPSGDSGSCADAGSVSCDF